MSQQHFDLISIRTIVADFIEDYKIRQEDVNEDELLKWAEDYSQTLVPSKFYKPRIAWLDVSNYKADKPKDLDIILEVAYRVDPPKSDCKKRGYQIVSWVQDTHEGCEIELNLNCPACHKTDCECHLDDVIIDIDRAWEINHPEIFYENYVKVGRFGYGTSVYDPEWKILCYTDNRFFGLNKHLPGCASTKCTECPHTYRVDFSTIETSFQNGEILVSYLGRVLDDEGYLMIPKHIDVTEAVLNHVVYKYYKGMFALKRDATDKLLSDEARILAKEHSTAVQAKLRMPSFEEFSKYWSKNKWSRIDSAYQNLMDGKAPVSDLNLKAKRNIYKS